MRRKQPGPHGTRRRRDRDPIVRSARRTHPAFLAANPAQQLGEGAMQARVRAARHVKAVADDVGKRVRQRLAEIFLALIELQHVDRAALFA